MGYPVRGKRRSSSTCGDRFGDDEPRRSVPPTLPCREQDKLAPIRSNAVPLSPKMRRSRLQACNAAMAMSSRRRSSYRLQSPKAVRRHEMRSLSEQRLKPALRPKVDMRHDCRIVVLLDPCNRIRREASARDNQ